MHADTEGVEDAGIETMLDPHPKVVGDAVMHQCLQKRCCLRLSSDQAVRP